MSNYSINILLGFSRNLWVHHHSENKGIQDRDRLNLISINASAIENITQTVSTPAKKMSVSGLLNRTQILTPIDRRRDFANHILRFGVLTLVL